MATKRNEKDFDKKALETSLKREEKICDTDLKAVTKALRENNFKEYSSALKVLRESVKNYNKILLKVCYAELLETENPVVSAVEQFSVQTMTVVEEKNKDSGKITKVKLSTKSSRIDLEGLCKFGNLSTDWVNQAEDLLSRLAIREMNIFSMSASELEKRSAIFIENANKKKDGETPDSNTQITKALQKLVDSLLFVDDGTGNNLYKCTVHDLLFINRAITRLDKKEKCTIATMNLTQFKDVIMGVLAHYLGVEYQVTRAKTRAEKIEERKAAREAAKKAEEEAAKNTEEVVAKVTTKNAKKTEKAVA